MARIAQSRACRLKGKAIRAPALCGESALPLGGGRGLGAIQPCFHLVEQLLVRFLFQTAKLGFFFEAWITMVEHAKDVALDHMLLLIPAFDVNSGALPEFFSGPITINEHLAGAALFLKHQHHIGIGRQGGGLIAGFTKNGGNRPGNFDGGVTADLDASETVALRRGGFGRLGLAAESCADQ